MPAATAASTGTSSGGGSKPARKSRVLKRKTDHSVIERRRREKINDRLIRLQTLVPACQEEAFEVLGNKPLPKHRRASRSNGMNEQAWSQEEMLVKMQSEMVLEKLCIISHTYDYVQSLKSQVQAYRKLCQCEAPLHLLQAVGTGPDAGASHKAAHEDFAHPASGEEEAATTSSNSDTNDARTSPSGSSADGAVPVSTEVDGAPTSPDAPASKAMLNQHQTEQHTVASPAPEQMSASVGGRVRERSVRCCNKHKRKAAAAAAAGEGPHARSRASSTSATATARHAKRFWGSDRPVIVGYSRAETLLMMQQSTSSSGQEHDGKALRKGQHTAGRNDNDDDDEDDEDEDEEMPDLVSDTEDADTATSTNAELELGPKIHDQDQAMESDDDGTSSCGSSLALDDEEEYSMAAIPVQRSSSNSATARDGSLSPTTAIEHPHRQHLRTVPSVKSHLWAGPGSASSQGGAASSTSPASAYPYPPVIARAGRASCPLSSLNAREHGTHAGADLEAGAPCCGAEAGAGEHELGGKGDRLLTKEKAQHTQLPWLELPPLHVSAFRSSAAGAHANRAHKGAPPPAPASQQQQQHHSSWHPQSDLRSQAMM